jgi:hypothetical protein
LEAGAAQYRSALRGLEGNRGFRIALGTRRARLGADPSALGTLSLALFAMLRIIFELLVVKEKLLARGEHKFGAAVTAFQNSVDKFHGRLPQ